MLCSSSPERHMSFSSLRVGVCTNASINLEIKFYDLKLIQRGVSSQTNQDDMDFQLKVI